MWHGPRQLNPHLIGANVLRAGASPVPISSFKDPFPMPFTMSQASVPVFEIGLNALSAVLDKAAAHATAKKIDASVMLGWRLVPDMFSLSRQVQVACDQAKNGGARLAGTEPPKFEDNETSLDQLKERVAKTVAYVKTLDAKA